MRTRLGMRHLPEKTVGGGGVVGARSGRASWFACTTLVCAVAGCSWLGIKPSTDSTGYQTEAARQGPLDVPPDLSPLTKDERFSVPDQGASANALRSASGTSVSGSSVALRGTKSRLVRDGAQRWLAVDLPPEKAYEVVKEFWPSVGLKLTMDQPTLGIVETDWQEKRPSVPTGAIQKMLNIFLQSGTSTPPKTHYPPPLQPPP